MISLPLQARWIVGLVFCEDEWLRLVGVKKDCIGSCIVSLTTIELKIKALEPLALKELRAKSEDGKSGNGMDLGEKMMKIDVRKQGEFPV